MNHNNRQDATRVDRSARKVIATRKRAARLLGRAGMERESRKALYTSR